jgi:hypothetical protein
MAIDPYVAEHSNTGRKAPLKSMRVCGVVCLCVEHHPFVFCELQFLVADVIGVTQGSRLVERGQHFRFSAAVVDRLRQQGSDLIDDGGAIGHFKPPPHLAPGWLVRLRSHVPAADAPPP